MEKEIILFVEELCDILEINKPKITRKMPKNLKHLLACARSDGKEIFINPNKEISLDLFFGIAHELRHCWQLLHCPEMLDNYTKTGLIPTNEYNLQPAEIDAHAFASLIMEQAFGVSPRFDNFSDEVRKEIEKRKEIIELQ